MPVDGMYFINPLDKTNKGGHIPVTAFGIIMTRRRDCDTHVRASLRANMCRFILTIGIF